MPPVTINIPKALDIGYQLSLYVMQSCVTCGKVKMYQTASVIMYSVPYALLN